MGVRPDNFNRAEDGSEATLVTPRFDAEEARRAHPVVPLVETRPRAAFAGPRAPRVRGVRRSWLPVLLVVALVAVATAAGALATNLIRRPQPEPVTQDVPAADAPVQAAEAPTQTAQTAQAEPAAPAQPAREQPRPKPAHRNRRAEEAAGLAAAAAARDDAEDSRGEDEGRRDKRRGKRRERDEGEGEKEMRAILKDAAKKKVPRLVGVLTGP
jgi:type IV secretory pathway VirB10-like protein